jgi:uncharacterized membrane protein
LALFNVDAGTMLLCYRATTIVPIATIGGLIALFGLAVTHGSLRTIPFLTGPDRIALFFGGTAGGAGVLLLWSQAIEHASAGRVATFVTATPMSTAITGAIVPSEPVTVKFVAGTVLIIAGIYLMYRTTEAATPQPRAADSIAPACSGPAPSAPSSFPPHQRWKPQRSRRSCVSCSTPPTLRRPNFGTCSHSGNFNGFQKPTGS